MSLVVDAIFSFLQGQQPGSADEYARVRARLKLLLDMLYLESYGEDSDLHFQMTVLVAAFDLQHL